MQNVCRGEKKRSVRLRFILVSDCLCVMGNAIGPGTQRRRVATRRAAPLSAGQR